MVEKKEVAIPVPAADNSPMEEDKPLKKTPKELKDGPIKDGPVKEELVWCSPTGYFGGFRALLKDLIR
jgi:hypothetical protein